MSISAISVVTSGLTTSLSGLNALNVDVQNLVHSL